MAEIKQLIHNGVLVPEIAHLGLEIKINGEPFELDLKQEQMAIAWVRKLSTEYVEDPIFCKNFFEDFSQAIGQPNLTDDNIDFSPIIEFVEAERARKKRMTKEEKKAAREERKAIREKLKEKYGYAILDGERVEISNWTAEPSSIFMGRGEHPLRGKWKEGPSYEDIIINLSPDAPHPEGNWKERVWEPTCLWIAKWEDKLSGKRKYVWLSDNTPLKQDREIEKFDKAKLVEENLEEVRKNIEKGIESEDKQRRMIATVSYIIDRLNLRVGDEKDEDEADTVGATTLRPEHITFKGEKVQFNFLGKDAVEWNKVVILPPKVIKVLKEFIADAMTQEKEKSQVFQGIGSRHVNAFLGEIVEGLTAKVFRTYHATKTVDKYLEEAAVPPEDPDYKKKEVATMANREAAIICNHIKKAPKGWPNRLQRFRERKLKAEERITKAEENQKKRKERLEELKNRLEELKVQRQEKSEQLKKEKKALANLKNKLKEINDDVAKEKLRKDISKAKKQLEIAKKRFETATKRVESAKKRVEKAKNSLGTAKERLFKAKEAKNKITSQERIAKNTKIWNLGTSLKSYIDPRVYYNWGRAIDYDWKNYYSAALQKKFSWVEGEEE